MPPRRRLIIVSNRGPVSYAVGMDGQVQARRGGGGLVTALRSLVTHHDVTWIASVMSEGDRVVAERHGGAAFEEQARDGSTFRLRLVWHPLQAYDWYYNVVANPVLWFAQHYLWGLAESPDWDQGLHNAWENGYCAVNRNFANVVVDELAQQPDATVFFHDYHLYVAPRLVRREAPDATLAHFVHIPWPQPDYWRVLPEDIRRAVHDGILANDVVGFHTARWRLNFLRSCADILGAEVDLAAQRDAPRRPRHACDRAPDLRRRAGVRRPRAERGRVVRRENDRGAPARVSRPARRPHRPVQERRPGAARLRALPRGASGAARPRADARLSRPVAPGHPRVRRVPRGDPARRANRERPLPDRRVDAARPPDRRQLRAVGRGLQAVRRPARERDLRRHEPGREGGAARERARRRAHPVGEHGRARAARGVGADREPLRRQRAGGGDPRGAVHARRGAAAAARGDPGAVVEHDITRWIAEQLEDLDEALAPALEATG